MLKYSKIGVNILTCLVVTAILLTILFINQIINNKKISKIVIPKIELSLEITDKQSTKDKYAKKHEISEKLKNNIRLEICNQKLDTLGKNEIILYVDNNRVFLYKIDNIKIATDTSLLYSENTKKDLLTIISKNEDRTITYIQAVKIGGVNEN